MNLGTREIGEVLQRIWTGMLGLEIGPATWNQARDEKDLLVGVVHLSGAWRGSLVMHCPRALARRAAAILLDKEPEGVDDDETRDVVGELTNVAVGNLVATFRGELERSLPRVLEGWQPELSLGPQLVRRFAFDCEGHVILIEVLEPCGAGSPAGRAAERRASNGSRQSDGHGPRLPAKHSD